MRAIFIEKTDVTPGDVIEMTKAEAHEVVQALPLACTDPRFHE
jgi:hypothetical protein